MTKLKLIVTKLKLWHSKIQIVTKLKNSNCDPIQKLKLWQNWKTQTVTKLKNSNFDKTQELKLWQNSNNKKIVTKLKDLNCDETQQLKLRQNSNSNCDKTKQKTLTVTKLKQKQVVTKLQNLNSDKTRNSNCDKTKKLKGLRHLIQFNRQQRFLTNNFSLRSLDSRLYYSHGTRTAGEVVLKASLLYLKITI